MGLRCLLGHDFGPPGVVREHEENEDGNEMVVTEREVQVCERCGEEQVLSESTEVRAIRSEAEMGLHDGDVEAVTPANETESAADADDAPMVTEPTDAEATAAGSMAQPTDAGADENDTHGELDDDAESDTSLIERAEAGLDESPDVEDAVILDDEDTSTERGHGEWPDSSDVGAPTDTETGDDEADRESESEREGQNAAGEDTPERTIAETAAEEDAELLDSAGDGDDEGTAGADDSEPEPAAESRGESETETAWPDHDRSDEGFAADTASPGGPDVSFGSSFAPQSTNGEGAAETENTEEYETSYPRMMVEERDGDGTIVSARGDAAARDPRTETEYYCPNCEHSRPLGSSLREGDICPECQRGYIAERER